MDSASACSSNSSSTEPAPSSDAAIIFGAPVLSTALPTASPPTCPDSTSDMQFPEVFYSSFAEVPPSLLSDMDTVMSTTVADAGISVVGEAPLSVDPWGLKTFSSDAFQTLTTDDPTFSLPLTEFNTFLAPGQSMEYSEPFLVTFSAPSYSCDGVQSLGTELNQANCLTYSRTIALDCDVVGVTRLVSDKGCQSIVTSAVEVPEVDSSTGRPRGGAKECNICHRSFSRLDRHVKAVHGEKKDPCECKEKRRSRNNCLRGCRFCNAAFPKYSLLRAHIRAEHAEAAAALRVATYPPCKFCGRKFNTEQKLRDHTLSHSGRYRYQCDMCDKGFAVVTDLQRHRRTHTGDRPYACEYCSKQFTQSGSLNRHKRNVHKIIVPKKEVM